MGSVANDTVCEIGDGTRLSGEEHPVENFEKLSLYFIHAFLAKNTSESPMDVPYCKIVGVLRRTWSEAWQISRVGGERTLKRQRGTKDHLLTGPVLPLDTEVWLGSREVDRCGEGDGCSDGCMTDSTPRQLDCIDGELCDAVYSGVDPTSM